MSDSLLGPQVDTEQATEQTQETQDTKESTTEQTEAKTTETKVEESKEQKTEEQKPIVPEKYEFTLPEGVELDTVLVDKVTPVFKELNLTQEQAQKLVAIQAEHMKAQMEEWKNTVEGWKEQTVKDLGPRFKDELAHGAKFRDQFLSKETVKFMDSIGLLNHPLIVKDFIKAGKMLAEDKLIEGNPTQTKVSTAKVLYPDNP